MSDKNVVAWLLMFFALAVHVFDETVSEFLPFYNQSVLSMRERLGFFPAPTFSFGLWIAGLVGAITAGFALTPLIKRGTKTSRVLSILLGFLMVANALGHLLGSLYTQSVLPGMWSSPLLLLTAGYLGYRGLKGQWQFEDQTGTG